ncbi:MAG TPA: NUDIX hydrolase [Opitutae bacterium]|nr:NUDIX hydrolase [Opitutaceae bacterium]HCR29978.1 NUDIX hydrolase [Opitutae bacterium]
MSKYRIGVLLYFRSIDGRLLLIRRSKNPNRNLWCAVGGKLEMDTGESPFECARREANEEVGMEIVDSNLSLRCILSEVDYESTGHWLMFVFDVSKPMESLPENIDEGEFGFFSRDELPGLDMPPLDKFILLERILKGNSKSLDSIHAGLGSTKNPAMIRFEETIG